MGSCAWCSRPRPTSASATSCPGCGAPLEGYGPVFVLTTPEVLDDASRAKLRAEWERRHAGLAGARRLAILEG